MLQVCRRWDVALAVHISGRTEVAGAKQSVADYDTVQEDRTAFVRAMVAQAAGLAIRAGYSRYLGQDNDSVARISGIEATSQFAGDSLSCWFREVDAARIHRSDVAT